MSYVCVCVCVCVCLCVCVCVVTIFAFAPHIRDACFAVCSSAAEMASVVDHSEVQLIFVSSRSLPLVREALDVIHQDSTKTSRVAHLVVINGDGSTSGGEEESKTSQPPAPATVASAADGAGAGFGGGAGAGAGSGADSSSLPDTCYLHEFATSDGELDDPLTMPRGGGEALFSLLYTSGRVYCMRAACSAVVANVWRLLRIYRSPEGGNGVCRPVLDRYQRNILRFTFGGRVLHSPIALV